MRFLIILLIFPFCISGQFFDAKSKVVYGFNFGTYIANNNSAVIYDGYKYANTSISNISKVRSFAQINKSKIRL